MIYFLGGPPRVGKSTISKMLLKQQGISVVSTDALGAVLESVLSPKANPGLFAIARFNEMPATDRINLMRRNTLTHINCMIEESRAIWTAVKPFVSRENEEGRDVLIEGVAVLPELVSQIKHLDFRVVFIGNQGSSHKENIKNSARNNPHDWMREASEEYIDAFATFVMRMSEYVEKEARMYGFKYVEMQERSFQEVAGEIMEAWGLEGR